MQYLAGMRGRRLNKWHGRRVDVTIRSEQGYSTETTFTQGSSQYDTVANVLHTLSGSQAGSVPAVRKHYQGGTQ